MANAVPNSTLYVNNLNEKESLYEAFAPYGSVLEVAAKKSLRMRGQAFVTFATVVQATQAMQKMQGSVFFDKPMHIAYAKDKSDAAAKAEGNLEAHQEARKKRKAEAEAAAAGQMPESEENPAAKRQHRSMADSEAPAAASEASAPVAGSLMPSQTLLLQDLPQACDTDMLTTLFWQFPGFKTVTLPPGDRRVAFVEFEDVAQASVAHTSMQGFDLQGSKLAVTFAHSA
ncbi:U1 small nuclear ribonucleoprotein A [Thecamonas trahens ATCC 50062]|uniref:U1 small nuclear ribonucleoprotein A n=1 Tax=Thecamonas trahens ATCC 50062 TaxID=461836 RepID=A0A0L0DVI8_THETB|nr:U1 small nuclear ribonucleoprotein A [Thecamonas trahens ATCC 50062]KNC56081.1 U1 small nuclear ribonucleoprotein A [Thecamonas trahens ATCC 50062]|eukprot:XP_013761125.1 U1 small nuclear ribonucleoprotein A [Thecamonas trahens ATCC 50062]